MSFVRNLWYVAGWSDEVEGKTLLNRTLLEEHVLMFRDEAGVLHAVSDVCPHRLAPLHMGKHCGDSVACGYHGLRFDGHGKCVHNPHQPRGASAALSLKSYPVAEKNKIIWIWMGASDRVDCASIPDFSFVDDAGPNASSKGYLHVRCHFELLSDNIMDLSHVDFLHETTLGTGAVAGVKPQIKSEGNATSIRWSSPNSKAIDIFDQYLPEQGKPADQWIEVVWRPPGVMTLENGATPAGCDPAEGVNTMSLHLMTPETLTTTHYFFLNSRDFDTDNAELNQMSAQFLASVFSGEDKPMIEAQQRYLGSPDIWSGNPVMMVIDRAPVQCRRVMQRLLKAEAEAD